MMKKLITFVALVVMASGAYAATSSHDSASGLIFQSKYLARWEVVDLDSLITNVADTGSAFPTNLFGPNQPFPDAITFWFEVATDEFTGATTLDSLAMTLQISDNNDSTQHAKRSLGWRPIWLNANADTINTTLSTIVYNGGGYYTLSAAQLAQMAGARWARWLYVKSGDATANDTIRLHIYKTDTYTGWKDQ